MGPDLRTSARDLLTLAQKVSTVLQRHSDKLLGDIEGAQGSLAPEEEALFSEQSQQALDVRRQVWETSKSLKGALEHIEDIEDEDEPRILREKMDTLQVHIREGLKIASDIETMTSHVRKPKGPEAIKITSATATRPKSESLPADTRATSGNSIGSWNRHPVGLFSTSPAKSPFATPAHSPAPRFTSTPKASIDSSLGHVGPSGILTDSGNSSNVLAPKASMAQTSKSTLVAVSDDPLSMGVLASVSDKPPPKDSHKERRRVATSSPGPSTAKTSPLITPSSPPAKLATVSRPTVNTSSTTQTTDGKECVAPKAQEPHTNPPQRRRVPRGLFSSASTSGSEPVRGPTLGNDFVDSNSINHTMSRGFSEGSTPQRDNGGSYVAPTPLNGSGLGIQGLDSILSSGGGSSSQSLSSQPQSPQSPITSAFSSPCISELKSPVSPSPLQRSQPKPSPIQISSSNSTPRSTSRNGKPRDDEEEISQLVRDLERAMNPTPTDPVPQVYFLQGEGMLERIPTQVSMDDGLLNDEGDSGQQSEDSDIAQVVQGEGSGLSRAGSGSLRRQRSGGKRRFRITRSRSRNRSRSRQENRNKPTLIPIEIGCPGTLASSEWPFEILSKVATSTGPRGRPRTSSVSGTLFPSRPQRDQATAYSARAQQWEPRAGPRLPFAESVSIGNPTRVGKGIGSFTVYSIALTLCATAKDTQTTPKTNRVETNNSISGGEDTQGRAHIESNRFAGQEPGCGQVEGTSSEHDHPPLSKAPSKAALMLTRSLSSSDLNFSAERLWMSMHFPEDLSHGSSAFASTPVIEPTLPSSAALIEPDVPPTLEPGQTIHVLKRYTDFVTLRAQLVEMLKSQSRNNGIGRGRKLFSRSLSGNNAAVAPSAPLSSATMVQTPPGHRSRVSGGDQDVGGYDDDDDDDDDDENRWTHSRTASGGTIVNSSSVSLINILRGMPKLPPKKVVGKFRPAFVEKRRRELEYFLEWVVAHPIIGDCPVVVQWFLEDQF
ncbi:hypothetical protein BGZ80_007125 [Entomortierella chlamydospora]|uniref:PX domain-containing protein n=1 Tax=Entomortierella chlamydospora TaxID=101097 RepID=A0A9P6N3K5_9FUNG|nr:hypothetical protein BGZ79_002904 [Entomortierella chlamydospora]KAG0023939.1 hypothetical protein BGZ80_007125 [Entomortierella chlamydospora]